MEIYIIDRFEEGIAVCEKEDRTMINIEKGRIPIESKEGDVLVFDKELFYVDEEQTKKRKEEIEKLAEDLWA